MKKQILFFILLSAFSLRAQNQPHFKLTIAPADLDSMYAHPKDEIYYPAVFQVDTFIYSVLARFKGSTTLRYPKKSWAIKFDNTNNYFGAGKIDLNANYKDHSEMRDFLILRLFDFFGSPSSRVQHVTYEVNGEAYGVYTLTEPINEDYLVRNGRAPLSLYKATNHGANFAPSVRDDYYGIIWNIEAGGDPSFNELRKLFNKCYYWSRAEFDSNISNVIDVDNFLTFFAVHFVFDDMDNFTKNIFLNRNSITGKYELLPWDNEGSFGNSAVGIFDSTLINYNLKDAYTPEYEVVLQRLLENPSYKTIFQAKINHVLNEGFSFLDILIDNTYLKIKQDVYADTKKEATTADFDNSIPQLKWFMAARKSFLQTNNLPVRNVLSDFYCSNPFPDPVNSMVTFRISSPVEQPVNMFFADSVNFSAFGRPFHFKRFQLYDDGLHNDGLANDLVYGVTIDANTFVSKLIPFTFTGAEQNYPANGIFYIDFYGTKSYAINKGNTNPVVSGHLKIGNVYSYNNNNYLEIINTSATLPADLSYCHLRNNNSTNDFMFGDSVVLAPNETIYITPSIELGNHFFPNKRSFSNLYYPLVTGDSLHLLSPVLSPMVSSLVTDVQSLSLHSPVLIIDEINFKSGTAKPTGDWVEIYNPGTNSMDMTGWSFKDGDNKHNFLFPSGYNLPSNGYVVIAEDLVAFQATDPGVSNVVGSTAFGLSSTGEYVRLYDNLGQLVDSVNFGIASPWPAGASGTGATLELKDYILDNTDGNNWYVDPLKAGSPGVKNFISSIVTDVPEIRYSVYPNPSHGRFFIKTSTNETRVDLYSLQGMTLKTIVVHDAGEQIIDVSNIPKGLYLLRLSNSGYQHIEKLTIR